MPYRCITAPLQYINFGRENVARRTVDLYDDGERHDDDGDEQVGDGQRREEVVGHVLQAPVSGDGRAQQRVAEHRRDDDQPQRHGAPLDRRRHRRRRRRRGGVVRDGRNQVGEDSRDCLRR